MRSNPKPLMVMVDALASWLDVAIETTGTIVATWIAPALVTPLVVTITNKSPATLGGVDKDTVSEVAVAEVTVPAALPSKSTMLLPAVVLKPNPAMVKVVASAASETALLVTTGMTVAISTAKPLGTLLVVTMAVRVPASVGAMERVTVSKSAVAEETVPTAPLLNTTVLLAAVVSKPEPPIVSDVASAGKFAALAVTTGTTVAT